MTRWEWFSYFWMYICRRGRIDKCARDMLKSWPMQITRDAYHPKSHEQQERWMQNDPGNQAGDQDISMGQEWNPKDQLWNLFDIKTGSHGEDENQGQRKRDSHK